MEFHIGTLFITLVFVLTLKVTVYPKSILVTEGDPTTFTCVVRSNTTTLQWYKLNTTSKKLGKEILRSQKQTNSSNYRSARVSIRNVTTADAGNYVCKAKHSVGRVVESKNFSLFVLKKAYQVVLLPIRKLDYGLSVVEGEPATFTCVGDDKTTKLQWYKLNKTSSEFEKEIYSLRETNESNYPTATFSIQNTTKVDEGDYVCNAKDREGRVFEWQNIHLEVSRNLESVHAGAQIMVPLVFGTNNNNNQPF